VLGDVRPSAQLLRTSPPSYCRTQAFQGQGRSRSPNAGGDTTNALKQRPELVRNHQGRQTDDDRRLCCREITDTQGARRIKATQGLIVTAEFYWE